MPGRAFAVALAHDKRALLSHVLRQRRERSEDHTESRRRRAVTREAISVDEGEEADIITLYLEGEDPDRVLDWTARFNLPGDRWFREHVSELRTLAVGFARGELVCAWNRLSTAPQRTAAGQEYPRFPTSRASGGASRERHQPHART